MTTTQANAVIEDSIIDDTFKGLISPLEVHSMGREDITEDRPGDVLVAEVKQFAAAGGFHSKAKLTQDDEVKTSINKTGRVSIEDAVKPEVVINRELSISSETENDQ
jgi:hypothetical protein